MGLGWGGLGELVGLHAVGRMGLCAPQWARGTGLHSVGRMGLGAPLLGVGLWGGRGGSRAYVVPRRGIRWLGRRSRRLGAPTVGVGITTILGGQFPVLCPSRHACCADEPYFLIS